jgi:hypothetical protein
MNSTPTSNSGASISSSPALIAQNFQNLSDGAAGNSPASSKRFASANDDGQQDDSSDRDDSTPAPKGEVGRNTSVSRFSSESSAYEAPAAEHVLGEGASALAASEAGKWETTRWTPKVGGKNGGGATAAATAGAPAAATPQSRAFTAHAERDEAGAKQRALKAAQYAELQAARHREEKARKEEEAAAAALDVESEDDKAEEEERAAREAKVEERYQRVAK